MAVCLKRKICLPKIKSDNLMSLREAIQNAQTQAMKERSEKKLSTLRLLWSAIKNSEIEKKAELSDEEILEVVSRQVKQLKDSLVDFEKGNRQDLVDGVKFEIEILETYLPQQLTDEELKKIVEKVLVDNQITESKDVGRAMGLVTRDVKGLADGNRVRAMVIELL